MKKLNKRDILNIAKALESAHDIISSIVSYDAPEEKCEGWFDNRNKTWKGYSKYWHKSVELIEKLPKIIDILMEQKDIMASYEPLNENNSPNKNDVERYETLEFKLNEILGE